MGVQYNQDIEKLNVMFKLQNKLNIETNGANWTSGVTKNGKVINWKRCIYMRAADFIDSFQWKHWRDINAESDIENAKIELVNIWHFLQSEMITKSLHNAVENLYKYTIFVSYAENKTTDDVFTIIKSAEKMISEAAKLNSSTNAILLSFFETCALIGLSFDELYTKYITKNVLNKFRQDNGNKDGSYVKIWDGEEDNVVATRIMRENPELSAEGLMDYLAVAYRQLSIQVAWHDSETNITLERKTSANVEDRFPWSKDYIRDDKLNTFSYSYAEKLNTEKFGWFNNWRLPTLEEFKRSTF